MKVGFVGLGAMGMPMALNLMDAGHTIRVFDLNELAVGQAVEKGAQRAASPREAADGVDVLVTMVPNDAVLKQVVSDERSGVLATLKGVHVSCSTVHPDTSRELAALHEAAGSGFVGAPIFARADGVAQRLASFCVGGKEAAVAMALPILEANSNGVFRFGEDPGAGNVVKLCGNYMIASAIESCSEALSLAEKSGLDRAAVMGMLNSTIFDCLIYKGYGERVARRSHTPGDPLVGPGFQLELGLKDVTLALDVAHKVQAPMPFASVLHDQFLAAAAKGRGKMDWSAIGLGVSEAAGVDISAASPAEEAEAEFLRHTSGPEWSNINQTALDLPHLIYGSPLLGAYGVGQS
eukprot:CAMPEP_0183344552 /NCGR_PEP_ID=MMETSP0164_2-20130417/10199_1 /TAXON_ID=221442 /ORGANISM="Coccolithus pelagicus ssp braarudi, Strain PLY182g" /LENGTH=349 /DNA_ID=CAMNT_0025515563 /DNA_START=69 /DNA_END=1117 /DNA_ORIENTATION=+